MQGINQTTGQPLTGTDHILQSVRDIITTPIGSRVMLRQYGCRLPDLVDRPVNALFDVELHASVAEALARWEPRFLLNRIYVMSRSELGRVTIGIEGTIKDSGVSARIEGLTL
jgi:phage baseplate assembly protein W